jgi:hypothetical protein
MFDENKVNPPDDGNQAQQQNEPHSFEASDAKNTMLFNDLDGFPSFDDEDTTIVPGLFNQLILFLVDCNKTMLTGEKGNTPYEQVYYSFSDFIENLSGFRYKSNYSFGVVTFSKEASLALDLTEVNNLVFGFLPSSNELLGNEKPLSEESNLIPALNLAVKLALTYEENKKDDGLPVFVNLVILTPAFSLDTVEIEELINQLTSHKNFRVYIGLWNELDEQKKEQLISHLHSSDDLISIKTKQDLIGVLKKAAIDNYRFKI